MDRQWAPYDKYEATSLAFSPNSRYLVTTALGSKPIIWDLHGESYQVLEGQPSDVTNFAWSLDGSVVASWSRDVRSIDATAHLWDANTFQLLHAFKHAAGSGIELAWFSPDGRWLLTGCNPTSYYIWDVALGTGQQLRLSVVPQARHIHTVASFDPSSKRIIIASPSGKVEILQTDGGEWDHGVPSLGCDVKLGLETSDVAFSPDGSLVLTLPSRAFRTNTMKIWDANTGVELLLLKGHEGSICDACFSPCGKYIASTSLDDCTVRLWRTSDGSCIATLCEHGQGVQRVAFSPDGKTLVVSTWDGLVVRQMRDIVPLDERES